MGLVVAQCFFLAAPVAVTGILHMVVVRKGLWPALAVPLDGGRTFRGVPIFGPNKTWRGVVFMVAGTAALGALQGLSLGGWAERTAVECLSFAAVGSGATPLGFALGYFLVNLAIGVGYVLGELPNSFLKRRLRITPGSTTSGLVGLLFFLLDQADSVIVGLLAAALFFPLRWQTFWVGVLCLSGLHLVINGSLYLARIRRNL